MSHPLCIPEAQAFRERKVIDMNELHAVCGTSALDPRTVLELRARELKCANVLEMPRRRGAHTPPASEVEEVLDDFHGTALTSSARERLVCGLMLACGIAVLFAFSFAL